MPKNNKIKCSIMRKCRGVKLAFNKFRNAVSDLKTFNADDEILIKLTLDNLLNEIRTATEIVKGRNRK